jgi:hypothetical protein
VSTARTILLPSPAFPSSVDLVLRAYCAEISRHASILTGALPACGCAALSRHFDPDGTAELEFECPRSACVDVYMILMAIGLELDASSHLRLTAFCQCARELHQTAREETARVVLRLMEPCFSDVCDAEESFQRFLDGGLQSAYEA